MSKKTITKSVVNNETTSKETAAMRTETKKNTTYTSLVIDILREMGENRLNRDDNGNPKTVPYRDKIYRELSSQYLKSCLKRDTELFVEEDSLQHIRAICDERNKSRKEHEKDETYLCYGNRAVDLTLKQLNNLLTAEADQVVDEESSNQVSILFSVDELCFLLEKHAKSLSNGDAISKALTGCSYLPPMLAIFFGRMLALNKERDHFSTQAAMIVPDAISINPVKVYQDSFTRSSSSRGLRGATAWGSQGKVSACIMHETYMLNISKVVRFINEWSAKNKLSEAYTNAVKMSLFDTVTALLESAYAMPSMKNSTYQAGMASYALVTLSNAQIGSNKEDRRFKENETPYDILETFKKHMLDSIDAQIQRQKNQSLRRGLGENCITVKQYEIDGEGVMTRREKYCDAPCDGKMLTDEDVKSDIVELLEKTL